MVASLVVVVIVGGVMAAITWMTLASTQPATAPEPRPVAPPPRPVAPPPQPVAPEPRPVAAAPPVPTGDLVEVRIPWWRRLRAAVGLGALGAVLGLGLAGLVGLVLLMAALALDRALG